MPISSFHDVLFPVAIALGASGGPVRRTEIVSLASGRESRNTRWAHSRRRYDAGLGLRSLDDLHEALSFFEARGGRLFGFRFRDPMDNKSCTPAATPASTDQVIGTGDGATDGFALVKNYGGEATLPARPITRPIEGSVMVAVDGVPHVEDTDFTVDTTTGVVTFQPGSIPASDAQITAGYAFDVPVRFDTDEITVSLRAFQAGDIPSIPIVEILQ